MAQLHTLHQGYCFERTADSLAASVRAKFGSRHDPEKHNMLMQSFLEMTRRRGWPASLLDRRPADTVTCIAEDSGHVKAMQG